VNHADGEVDGVVAQRAQLAQTESCVEGRRPQWPLGQRQRLEQPRRFLRRRDIGPLATDGGQVGAGASVHRDVAVTKRAAVDHAQRQERVSNGARALAVRDEAVGEGLYVAAAQP